MDFPAAKWLEVEQVEARFRAVVVDHLTFHLHFLQPKKATKPTLTGVTGTGGFQRAKDMKNLARFDANTM